jgi:hypothetical protein
MFHVKPRTIMEGESMTDTVAVEIPADVKDNNTTSIRVQWRSTRPVERDEIETGRKYRALFGYGLYEWDDVDRDGKRVTLHRFVNKDGQTVDLYATYYFTRVACTDCVYSYATSYIAVTDADGVTHPATPLCDWHGSAVRRMAERSGYTWSQSEPLEIGQHD